MTAFYAPDPVNSTQFVPGSNTPASGALLFCYQVGSSTKQNTYTDQTASTARTNPIVLDSGGNIPGNGEVWIASTAKFVLAPFNDTDPPLSPYWTRDNLSGVNDISSQLAGAEWVNSPLTPTFVGSSTFALIGDQTQILTKGRRVKAPVTAGTVYGMIVNSVFGTSTTISIASETFPLDSGLNSFSYGLLSSINPSVPGISSTNTFHGIGALSSNVFGNLGSGDQNTAYGFQALANNVSGRNCVAIGSHALEANTSGTQNCAIGNQTLQFLQTGSNNVAVGNACLHDNLSGSANVGVGIDALRVCTGSNNTAVGVGALASIVANGANTAVGSGALATTIGSGCVSLGTAAGKYETGSDAFYVDNQDRVNTAGDKAGAILYGTFSGVTANQRLQQNAIVTKPVQPAFLVMASAGTNVTGDGTSATVAWGTEIYDQHSDFTANTFTAPVTGRYHFDVMIDATDLAVGNTLFLVSLVTSNRTLRILAVNPGTMIFSGELALNGGVDVDMDSADTATVTLRVDGATKIIDISTSSYWSGHLVA